MGITENRKYSFAFACLFLFSAWTLFYHLGDRLLWGDEAETALLGINITRYGIPKAIDGNNSLKYGAGAETNSENVWVWSPWIDEYIVAGSFLLFSKTTLAARIPFALIGFLSVLLFSFVVWKIFRTKEITLLTTLLYVTNIGFLLHARQCRYYSLIFISQVGLIYALSLLFAGRSKYGISVLVGALLIQFYSNYILVLPNIIALLIFGFIISGRYPHFMRTIAISFGVFALGVFPWLLYAKPWNQLGTLGVYDYSALFVYYVTNIDQYIFPFALFLLPVLHRLLMGSEPARKLKNIAERDILLFLLILAPVNVLVVSATPGNYFRYLLPMLPGFILVGSVVLWRYIETLFVRILLVLVLSCTNIFSTVKYFHDDKQIIDISSMKVLSSIASHYENKLSDVVAFFRGNAKHNESILVADPEFPLIFYTEMHVQNVIVDQTIDYNNPPEWILTENASGVLPTELVVPEEIKHRYDVMYLKVHDTPHGDCRTDPGSFIPYTTDSYKELQILRRK
jgi:hypothetical protein